MESEPRRWAASRRGIALCVAIIAVLTGYLLEMRIGGSAAVSLPGQGNVSAALNRLMPQGWAFFTKPTLSATPIAFERDRGRWVKAAGFSNARVRYAGGLSREGRRQGVEMASILEGIPKEDWRHCDGRSASKCVERSRPAVTRNPLPHPSLCGAVIIAAVKPVPWQWRDLVDDGSYVDEAISLRVEC